MTCGFLQTRHRPVRAGLAVAKLRWSVGPVAPIRPVEALGETAAAETARGRRPAVVDSVDAPDRSKAGKLDLAPAKHQNQSNFWADRQSLPLYHPFEFSHVMCAVKDYNPLVIAWRGKRWEGRVGHADGHAHAFGGPLDLSIRGASRNARHLHRVLSLDLSDARFALQVPNVDMLPLVYGFTFDGCSLEYKVASDRQLTVLDLSPGSPSPGWPYANYPKGFPRLPLQFIKPKGIRREQVTELTCQGLPDEAADQLVVVVYPSKQFGVSLWGEEGDLELVEVIFLVDPETGRVSVTNQCT